MPLKLGATGITFHDNSVQTTAGGPVTTQYAIGSYVIGRPADFTSYNNTTIAGSSLYATGTSMNYNNNTEGAYADWYLGNFGNAGNSSFISLINTGSWRCVSIAGAYTLGGSPPKYMTQSGLWVRYA
jgi:hypothetical protein